MTKIKALVICICLGCNQPTRETENQIIDPITISNFETEYHDSLFLNPTAFPPGSKGYGVVRIFIDSILKIEKFEIEAIRISNKDSVIYNYNTDKENEKTSELVEALGNTTRNIKIKKNSTTNIQGLEPYDILIKFVSKTQ